jgi:LysR family transcriptional regulator, nitrogen assimilation regulatory protein
VRIRHLRSFIRVCQVGSITRAAADLHIAQPALGLQIRSLEEEFGTPLVVRSARGVAPTPQGEVVLAWAQEVLQRTKQVRQQLAKMSTDAAPTLTIGLTPSLASLMAGALAQMADEQLPRLSLNLIEDFGTHIAHCIEEESIDIGLCFDPQQSSALEYTPLMNERLCYISAREQNTGPITLEEALTRPLALPEGSQSIRMKVEAAARTIHVPVVCKYEISSLQAAKDFAMRGLAGVIVPFGGVKQCLRSSDLSVRMVVSPMVERTLFLMRRSDRAANEAEQQLTEIIRTTLKSVVNDSQDLDSYVLLPSVA